MSDKYKKVSAHVYGASPRGTIIDEWTSGHHSAMGRNFHAIKELPDGRLVECVSSNGGYGWNYVERAQPGDEK